MQKLNVYEVMELNIDGRLTYWRAGSMTRLASRNDHTAGCSYDYQQDCSACWLGFAHSLQYHERNLETVTGLRVPRF